jgi:hypothetical protein
MYAYVIVSVYVNRTPPITILAELKHAQMLSKQVLFYVIISWHLLNYTKKLNSVVLVHKRTIPTKRPLLVSEVSANFSG